MAHMSVSKKLGRRAGTFSGSGLSGRRAFFLSVPRLEKKSTPPPSVLDPPDISPYSSVKDSSSLRSSWLRGRLSEGNTGVESGSIIQSSRLKVDSVFKECGSEGTESSASAVEVNLRLSEVGTSVART